MTYEMLVGLQVADPEKYQDYRNAMQPLLKQHGGGFRYDFWVDKALVAETSNDINRLFIIYFPDKALKEAFFSNLDYQAFKQTFFTTSVAASTVISEYVLPD